MPRRTLDFYETPPHYVQPLLALVSPLDHRCIYEPCVGEGHISRYFTEQGAGWFSNDIDPARRADTHLDARTEAAWLAMPSIPDWTITNPPFNDELAILQLALRFSKNVAFLARLSFLEPTRTRSAFWTAHPPTDVIVLPRYSFRLNDSGKRQTDSVTCCWLVFRENKGGCVHFSGVRP